MDDIWKDALWSQFGAAIDMFGNALEACPAELWDAHLWNDPATWSRSSEFWYIAYHTLFWLDLYLTGTDEDFTPPAPYNLDELNPRGVLPDRNYSKDELQSYLAHCRRKCRETVMQLTDEKVRRVCKFSWKKDGLS